VSTSGGGNGKAEHSGGEEESRKTNRMGRGSGMGQRRVPGGGAGEGSGRPAMAGRGGGRRRSGGTVRVQDGTGEGARGSVWREENGSGLTETEEFSIYSKEFSKGSDLIWLKDGLPEF
jgi:hypothetical protein